MPLIHAPQLKFIDLDGSNLPRIIPTRVTMFGHCDPGAFGGPFLDAGWATNLNGSMSLDHCHESSTPLREFIYQPSRWPTGDFLLEHRTHKRHSDVNFGVDQRLRGFPGQLPRDCQAPRFP